MPKIMSPSNGSQSDIQVGPWLSIDKAVVLLLDTKAKKRENLALNLLCLAPSLTSLPPQKWEHFVST